MPVALVVRIAVIGRRVEAPMEVTPVVMEMRPVVGMTISIAMAAAMEHPRRAITAATEHRRGTKAAAMDRAASEPAAVERSPAAPESAAMKPAAAETTAVKAATATAEAAAVKATPAAAEATASTATETTTAAAAMLDFCRQPVGCKFRRRYRAGTRKRERLGALL